MELPSYINENLKLSKKYALSFLRWLVLGIAVGVLCGLVGAAFSHSIVFVTGLRSAHSWLLFLLPVGGLLSVAVYKLCRVTDIGTNCVFDSVRTEKPVPFLLAPAVFVGSVITHLLGGSAGKEGAALQLGGSISSLFAKVLRLDERSRHILTMCGMGALFAAVFGTPVGACVFAVEVVRVGQIRSAALFPTLVSGISAYGVAGALGVKPERFHLSVIPNLDPNTLWRMMIIAITVAIVSGLFCHIMHITDKLFKKYLPNPYLRIVTGAVVIVALTLLLGTTDYNGGGVPVIEHIFETGEVRPEAFILKILFTAITIGCGFKGGEIVPSFFIGATLGATLAPLVGLDPAFGAAVGMAAMFCGVTNCPLATCFLCVELFGGSGVIFFTVASFTGFILSGYSSLYSSQRLMFSKLDEQRLANDDD